MKTLSLKNFLSTLLAISLFFMLAACTKTKNTTEITVASGATFTDSLKKCAELYETKHPDIKIRLSFSSAGVIASQIVAGAPIDIFLSGTEKHANMIMNKGFGIKESERKIISNKIVLITKKELAAEVKNPEDLLKKEIQKIALGNFETTAVGAAGKEVFEFYKIIEDVRKKAVFGETVRQVLDYVAKGEADAGIVSYTDYLTAKEKVTLSFVFPESSHTPVVYPFFILKASQKKGLAEDFVQFLESQESLNIFKNYGYKVKE